MTSGAIKMLRIEVDGHFHGSPDVPRPWVARIDGTDHRFGLRRTFVQKLNDWKDAKRAWSGNLYGVVATFPLRDGHLYEVSRLRGKPSKRHVAREFLLLDGGKTTKLEPLEALAHVEGHSDPVSVLRLPDGDGWRVAELAGVGGGDVRGWVVVDGQRLYRLRHDRLYQVDSGGSSRLVLGGPSLTTLSQQEALQWLAGRLRQTA